MASRGVILSQAAITIVAWLIAVRLDGARWTTPSRSAGFLGAFGTVFVSHGSEWAASVGRMGLALRLVTAMVWICTLAIGLGVIVTGSCDTEEITRKTRAYCLHSQYGRQLPRCQKYLYGGDYTQECTASSIFQRAGVEGLAAGTTFLTAFALSAAATESTVAAAAGAFQLCGGLSAAFVAIVAVGESLHYFEFDVPTVWRPLIETALNRTVPLIESMLNRTVL